MNDAENTKEDGNVHSETHVFVLWPKALKRRDKILADISQKTKIIASFMMKWPKGVSAEAGYRHFYGTMLPDSAGKVKRAGTGPFLVVVVRMENPKYDWRMTQRGLEYVNRDLYGMKWNYRNWVGGLHRVHGTTSPEEARRDILTLTGFTIDDWNAGRAKPPSTAAFPGLNGWGSMTELFAFLDEVYPYAVMRNYEGLPEKFNPEHDDVDMLVPNAGECASFIYAKKRKGAGAAAYSVKVGGRDVKLDIREIGDGYYPEAWERRMLANRVKSGVYTLAPEDTFYALVYHVLYMKPSIKPDYCAMLPQLAASTGVGGTTPSEWIESLEKFLAKNSYHVSTPLDSSVHLNTFRVGWRDFAAEAEELFSLRDVRPYIEAMPSQILSATMDGKKVRVRCPTGEMWRTRSCYDIQKILHSKSPEFAAQPLHWHTGRDGRVYIVTEDMHDISMRGFIDTGKRLDDAMAEKLADSALRLIAALDDAGIVHRNITAETLRIRDDGSLALDAFDCGVRRKDYKAEGVPFRRGITSLLIPLGGDGVAQPGVWNDRHALAVALAPFAEFKPVAAAISRLESEAAKGTGNLRIKLRKLSIRMAMVGVEFFVRGLLSSRRRKSEKFRRISAFVKMALFGIKAKA